MSKICVVGLGPMGLNLALNMKDKGIDVVGFNRSESKRIKARQLGLEVVDYLDEATFEGKKIFWIMVKDTAVDEVMGEVAQHCSPGDVIIEGGNSYFKDTDRRAEWAEEKGFTFIGTGVSGGEEGARYGPAMMPGGTKEAYHAVEEIFSAIAAKAPQDDKPCVSYIGPGGAGHFVKMVHNGIEYGIMAMIGEIAWLIRDPKKIKEIFSGWNEGVLSSYLVEITADSINEKDGKLIEEVADITRMKGTGAWTCTAANELLVPVPTIYAALTFRMMSMQKKLRMKLGSKQEIEYNSVDLKDALYTAIITSYAQGLALISKGSDEYGYDIDVSAVAKDWRAGCIIRQPELLHAISESYAKEKPVNLIDTAYFRDKAQKGMESLSQVTTYARKVGVPTPVLDASLSYLQMMHSSVMFSASVNALLRDYFGAHQYLKIDKDGNLLEGEYHTEWMDADRPEKKI